MTDHDDLARMVEGAPAPDWERVIDVANRDGSLAHLAALATWTWRASQQVPMPEALREPLDALIDEADYYGAYDQTPHALHPSVNPNDHPIVNPNMHPDI